MFSEPLVAIIIVHWGFPIITMECIKSIRSCNYGNLHIIVVDNCSEQRLWRDPLEVDHEVTYIQSETNLGYAGGNNIGIIKALELEVKYILLLNNDTIVDNDMIIHCVTYLEGHPDVSVISPKILFYNAPEYINVAGGKIDLNTGQAINFGMNEKDMGQFDTEKEITFATGCAFFTRASIFEQIGLFDENLFCYCEDSDFSRRIVMAGFRLRYLPSAKVWHKQCSVKLSGGKGLPSRFTVYYFWRNQLYNLQRYISGKLAKEYTRFGCSFIWSLASFSLKHGRFDLTLSMLLGLFDSIAGRMGNQNYSFFRCSEDKNQGMTK